MEKPDIVLLVVDSLRADHLGCYGYDRDTSPNLDRLAEEGVKFEHCYANSFCSMPSHASLFSGKLVSDHRVFSNTNPFFDAENALVDTMKQEGYHTYGNSNNHWVNDLHGFEQGFDEFDYQMWYTDIGDEDAKELLKQIQKKDWSSTRAKYLHTLRETVKRGPGTVLKFLSFKFENSFGPRWGFHDKGSKKTFRRLGEKLDAEEKPMFGFANLMEVHAPYMPPLTFPRKFSSRRIPKEGITNAQRRVQGDELQERIDLYDDCIRYIDGKIGEFVEDTIEKNPGTVFIITSDHGEMFFDNDLEFEERRSAHRASCSDQLLHVPLIVYGDIDEEKFDVEKATSLMEMKDLLKSISRGEDFAGKGYAIEENIWDRGPCSKMITDGENKVVQRDDSGTHFIGDREKGEELLEILGSETQPLEKLRAMFDDNQMLDSFDI